MSQEAELSRCCQLPVLELQSQELQCDPPEKESQLETHKGSWLDMALWDKSDLVCQCQMKQKTKGTFSSTLSVLDKS